MGEQSVFALGSQLYGYIPEYHGSRGVFGETGPNTGGLLAGIFAGPRDRTVAAGRGDNPGLTMQNIRFDTRLFENYVYRTQYRNISYNEDFYPFLSNNIVTERHIGNEWVNELYFLFNWNAIVQLSYTTFIPGKGMAAIAESLTGSTRVRAASRVASEFIWRF